MMSRVSGVMVFLSAIFITTKTEVRAFDFSHVGSLDTFNFYLWPENAGETLKGRVKKLETDLSGLYAAYAKKLDIPQKAMEATLADLNKKIEAQLKKDYGCWAKKEGEVEICRTGEGAVFRTPEVCEELLENPWKKSEDEVAACDEKIGAIQQESDEKMEKLGDEILQVSEVYTPKISDKVEEIIMELEPSRDNPEKMDNWVPTDLADSFIEFVKDKNMLDISLGLQFNTTRGSHVENASLIYKSFKGEEDNSDYQPEIDQVVWNLEGTHAPAVKFRIKEKRVLEDGKEESTGNYYLADLKGNEQTNLLRMEGTLEKFNKDGGKIREGKMSMFFFQNQL